MSKNKFIAYDNVFDQSTLRGLFKLSSQGYFEEIGGPIKIGKESNVFSVDCEDEKRVVKIYRTAANFKKMHDFMKPDPRYANVGGGKIAVISAWCRKEFSNLLRARKHGVRVPTPYAYHKNIICMEYIGDSSAAPTLQKVYPKDVKGFYKKLFKEMKKLYKARLVHTDLSEYNILNWNDEPVLIDFSQAVDFRFPQVEFYLERDVRNVVRFFNRLGMDLVYEEELKRLKG
tara:strand:- start:584 stop:1273 length:690 start_codon:yes stop_codon:yes gene_type:complete